MIAIDTSLRGHHFSVSALTPRLYCLFCFCVLLSVFLAGPSAGQEAPAGETDSQTDENVADTSFVESMDVNIINIEVFVTDKSSGESVTGLERDDFELLVDRRPVEISNFYAVERGRAQQETAVQSGPATADDIAADDLEPTLPDRSTRPDGFETPPEQRLHLIIYVDNLFIRPFNRNRVLMQLRQFLQSRLQPGDQVMLVTFDRSLHVRHNFTTDHREISDALYELDTLSAFAVQGASSRRQVLRSIELSQSRAEADSHVSLYAESVLHDVDSSLRNLQDLMETLSGIGGRKALLYVSDGLPINPAEDLFMLIDNRFRDRFTGNSQLRASRYTARNKFRSLTRKANSSGVTFYTLEAAGLRNQESLKADYGAAIGAQGGTDGSYVEIDFVRQLNMQEPLLMMADDTGGQATINSNDIAGALGRYARDFGNYYSLGYRQPAGVNGGYRTIEVKLKDKKGKTIRHRSGYRDKDATTRLLEGMTASLLYDLAPNPLGLEMRVHSPTTLENSEYRVPVDVRIPLGALALVPRGSTFISSLVATVAVVDDKGRRSPPQRHEIPIEIPAADLEIATASFFTYSVELVMRPGDQKITVGLRDQFSGQTSYVRNVVRVGPTGSG